MQESKLGKRQCSLKREDQRLKNLKREDNSRKREDQSLKKLKREDNSRKREDQSLKREDQRELVTMILPPTQMNINMLTACSTDWTIEFDEFNDEHGYGKYGCLIKEIVNVMVRRPYY